MARSGSRHRPVRQQAMCGNNLQMALRRIICGAAALAGTGVALAYPVGPALSLAKLTAEADLIFKGTTGSSQQVEDDWFKPYPGFVAGETEFKVISVNPLSDICMTTPAITDNLIYFRTEKYLFAIGK